MASAQQLRDGADPNRATYYSEKLPSFREYMEQIIHPQHSPDVAELPILMAERVGNPEVLRLLLNAGARTEARDVFGETLLKSAERKAAFDWHMCYNEVLIDKQRGVNRKAVLELLKCAAAR